MFSRREEKRFREIVRLGIMDAWKEQKKDIVGTCMTRIECLSLHQGRSSAGAGNGNGALKKEQIKFWGKLSGLIVVVGTLISALTAFILSKLS